MKKRLQRAAEKAYLIFGFAIFISAMLLVFPILALASRFSHPGRRDSWFRLCLKFWASSFFLFGIRFRSTSVFPHFPPAYSGPFILVANHNSLLDTPALYYTLSRFTRPLAKIELTRPPVFGHLCSWVTLPVDRNSPQSRREAMEKMETELRRGGSLLIFPEGRTNRGDSEIGQFEAGAFRLSTQLGVPIVSVLIRNSRHCLAPGSPMILRPGRIDLEPGPIFFPKAGEDPKALQKKVWNWYAEKLGVISPGEPNSGY